MPFNTLKIVSDDMYSEYQSSLEITPYLCTPCIIHESTPPPIMCYMEISKQPPFDITDITLMVKNFHSANEGINEKIDFIINFMPDDENKLIISNVELREWGSTLEYGDIMKILYEKLEVR